MVHGMHTPLYPTFQTSTQLVNPAGLFRLEACNLEETFCE
jgi:hypothetical protein